MVFQRKRKNRGGDLTNLLSVRFFFFFLAEPASSSLRLPLAAAGATLEAPLEKSPFL